ncbi:sortase [Candidatus Nephthysia bennettiae]|uniref:Class F sortase n=1 Tax=Candidatus Nephthysia bennettiae TaxID=3127016 RepID=A0A934K7M9_9BACT|nr:class F sortase [Candidatus Dormibacteraeota bacterium]MBJ7610698.1 class F sortase [Candidatus Dormibacteraeota bacterium]
MPSGRFLAWALALSAASLVLGCGQPAATSAQPSVAPTATASPVTPTSQPGSNQRSAPRPAGNSTRSIPAPPSLIGLGVPAPDRVRIPSINVDSPLVLLDRNPDGTIQLPPDPGKPGWYRRGVAPGDLGTAVIMGDVGSASVPGVFSRLSSIRSGDEIRIQRTDGSELLFVAQRSLAFSPSAFPAAEVYRGGGGPGLRLFTCGATAAPGGSPTTEDVVVFATLSG